METILGALKMGDRERAEQNYELARQQLGSVFDLPDYSVAEALMGMRYCSIKRDSREPVKRQ